MYDLRTRVYFSLNEKKYKTFLPCVLSNGSIPNLNTKLINNNNMCDKRIRWLQNKTDNELEHDILFIILEK